MSRLLGVDNRMAMLLQTMALVLLAPGIVVAFLVVGRALLRSPAVEVLGLGVLAGLLIGHVVSRHVWMLDTFEHELTHWLAALLFLCIPTDFVATRRGGYVGHSRSLVPVLDPLAQPFIALAPYVVPTYTVILVLVRGLIAREWLVYWDAAIGLTFGYHVVTTVRETVGAIRQPVFESVTGRVARSDLARVGFLHAAVYVPVVTLAIHGVLIAAVVAGWRGVRGWWATVVETTGQLVVYVGSRVLGGALG